MLLNTLGRVAVALAIINGIWLAGWICLVQWRRYQYERGRQHADGFMIPKKSDLWQIEPPLCPGCSARAMEPVVIAEISRAAALWRCTSCQIDLHRFIDGSRGRQAVEAYLAAHEMESAT